MLEVYLEQCFLSLKQQIIIAEQVQKSPYVYVVGEMYVYVSVVGMYMQQVVYVVGETKNEIVDILQGLPFPLPLL